MKHLIRSQARLYTLQDQRNSPSLLWLCSLQSFLCSSLIVLLANIGTERLLCLDSEPRALPFLETLRGMKFDVLKENGPSDEYRIPRNSKRQEEGTSLLRLTMQLYVRPIATRYLSHRAQSTNQEAARPRLANC